MATYRIIRKLGMSGIRVVEQYIVQRKGWFFWHDHFASHDSALAQQYVQSLLQTREPAVVLWEGEVADYDDEHHNVRRKKS
jgi:hypothetical protein